MRALFARASLAMLAGVVCLAPDSKAGVVPTPSPPLCEWPCAIEIVPAPATSSLGTLEILIRDRYGSPIANESITIDFSLCGADVRLAQQQQAGVIMECVPKWFNAFTDAQGRVSVRVIGGSSGAPALVRGPCARIGDYNWGIVLGTVQVAVYDLNGANGLTAGDLSIFLQDFFAAQAPGGYAARSDYTYAEGGCTKQEITAADLSRWLDVFLSSNGTTFGVPFCAP